MIQYERRFCRAMFFERENKNLELRPVFMIANLELRYSFAIGNYQQTTSAKSAVHTSVVEIVIEVCQSGASRRELRGHADYRGHGRTAKHHYDCTDEVKNISCIALEEQINRVSSCISEKKMMLRPEQISVE